MNALEASELLAEINYQIAALEVAYQELWSDFDKRIHAIVLGKMRDKLEIERISLDAKLRGVKI